MILLHAWIALAGLLAPQEPPQTTAQEPALLAVPEGWRYERLGFPLAFAPELELRGFEDLSFAPGMFDPASDSYFSYALALKLEGDVWVDEGMLARFLETYYGGLYRAVAVSKNLPVENRPTRASVRRDAGNYRARVETFDAFSTGNALTLELELALHSSESATELLGLASPMAADAPIWSELREIGEIWRSTRPFELFLNHVYAVVDRETYAALAASKFLREEFGVSEERATKRADISYSGLYFYGRRTYFEFLPPEAGAGLAEGNCGLAFGVEGEGELLEIAARLEKQGIQSQHGPITRELGGEQLPWFKILGVQMPPSPLNVFGMEYEDQFLKRWHHELAPRDGGQKRADVLARYAAALKRSDFHRTAPFADVTGIEFALDPAQTQSLTTLFTVAGNASEVRGPAGYRIHGPQFSLLIQPSDSPGGVKAIEVTLREPIEREPLRLGQVSVIFSGKKARFEIQR